MNTGRGFSNPRQNGVFQNGNGDSWIPLTPQKPILSRANLLQGGVAMQMQQNYIGRSNWDDLLGMYSGLLESQANNNGVLQHELANNNGVFQQELANNNGVFQDFTPSGLMYTAPGGYNPRNVAVIDNRGSYNICAGSIRQSLGDNNPVWYRNPLPDLPGVNSNGLYQPSSSNSPTFYAHSSNGATSYAPYSNYALYEPSSNGVFVAPSSIATPDNSCYISNKQPHVSSSLSMLEGNSLGYDSASYILPRQNNIISSNPRTSEYNLLQAHKDGFPVPYRPIYNLNSPPKSEGGVASSAVGCFRFAPVTPDQGKQLKNQQLCGISNFLIDEGLSQGKDKQENLVVSNQQPNVERHSDELQNLVDLSTTDFAASVKENQATIDEEHGGIDLNETPKQKPPRRRKHRPKVVREGKPKKTATPKTPKNNNTSIEHSTGKRKYVRKKGINASATPQGNATDEVKISDISGTKSCRRVLNFDLESPAELETRDRVDGKQAEKNEHNKELFNLNLDFQDQECSAEINRANLTSALRKEKQQGYTSEIQHRGTMVTYIPSTNTMPAGASSSLIPATATANNRTVNVIARNLSMRSASLYPNGNQNGYNQSHQDILGEGVGHSTIQGNATRANMDRTRQLLQQSPQVPQDVTGVHEQRGPKRPYCQTTVLPHAQCNTLTGSRLLGIYTEDGRYVDSSNLAVNASETFKKIKFSNVSNKPTDILSSCIPATNSCSRQMDTRMANGVYTSSSTLHFKGKTPDYSPEKESSSSKLIRSDYQRPVNQHMNGVAVRHDFLERHASSQVILHKEQPAKETSQPNSHVHTHNSLAIVNWNMQSPINIASRSPQEHENATAYTTNMTTKKQRQGPATSKQRFSRGGLLFDYQNCSTTMTGGASLGQKKSFDMIDNVIDKLSGLHISDSGKEVMEKGQTALVPYKADGSIVPYNGVDSIKRRRPRPKVDLDPESNRLWNLLMGKESAENVDKHTEKWWEEERNVFRGRIDSFIARMHLVQGDRRFSPWKGSVVDSVIGVFLTQNVSDHLSSSAFMSLAAKFPPPPTKQTCWWNGAQPIVEEPEVQIIDPDGTITYHARITRQPVYYQSSTTSSETSEQRPEDPVPSIRASSEKKNKRMEDEVLSSQTSPDSIIYQAIEEARYGSGSNSEAEGRMNLLNSHKGQTPQIVSLQEERTAGFQGYGSHVMQSSFIDKTSELRPQQSEYLAHFGQNLPLERGSDTYASSNNFNMPNMEGCPPSSNQWSHLVQAAIDIQPAFPNKHPEPISYPQSITNGGCNQHSIKNNQEKSSRTSPLVKTYSAEPMRPAEALPKIQTGETSTSNKPANGTGTGISNVRKRKLEREKTKVFDWDSLRKQVHSKGGRKGRSKDAMDSLDYEALRHADVKKISDTIKERGMNNMLAERIKDFLNRLVEEHERIDLEWLREVPADKAKDYLLSIRGLGLKSVECVRLLTLRNVAFPVDTNVGRIAVRLGWVPLQPLPESLQLHLLELYPVLESIQKYLWPRLCKLDQKTLYELHYQMITFGKVFCTKSKPNCNACPMRGECRHFASAFASARLALPGPEERGIVNSTAPIAVQEIHAETFLKHMALLPPADTNPERETGFSTYSSEPIIDEPATPELSIEVTESDIEDAFYNDPDEIPTIKLNIEEFTTNLQSFMQEHTEMQEGDLSKAIVALNPTVASIPTPKLKNVNRLRTEHQVYELPDSHPLLKGLDRREPDDPSPYLLAIWTPGETADSIQLPESKCDYQGLGRLCNENTCFSCNSIREANSQTVRGTILIPCRTAMRGSFPLNGTYFQVNEVFADHKSSLDPIDVPRSYIWNLPRRTVYFGTSVTSIFKGLTTEGIQFCFWRGFVCVRGFDQKTRAPRPLMARLHFPASKMVKTRNEENKKKATLPKE